MFVQMTLMIQYFDQIVLSPTQKDSNDFYQLSFRKDGINKLMKYSA